MKTLTKLWVGIGLLVLLCPLGLWLPAHFKAKGAWGEWGADSFKEWVGYVPQGLKKLSGLWSAPLPDYALGGGQARGWGHGSFAYIMSALAGIGIVVIVAWGVGRLLARKDD